MQFYGQYQLRDENINWSFHGACPQPKTTKNVMGLPNGPSMTHWRKNNLNSDLNNLYPLEIISGWGSDSEEKFALITDEAIERYLICPSMVLRSSGFIGSYLLSRDRKEEWSSAR